MLREPAVLAGRELGFLRVRGLAEGTTELSVGGASVEVGVRPLPTEARVNQLGVRIVAPAPGAAVWGAFSVGVEVAPGLAAGAIETRLRLPDGELLEPARSMPAESGLVRRLSFEVDADAQFPGPLQLVAETRADGGESVSYTHLTLPTIYSV